MTGQEPERLAVINVYEQRLNDLIDQIAHRPAGSPLPQEAAGLAWLPATAILSNALRAERWDPTPPAL